VCLHGRIPTSKNPSLMIWRDESLPDVNSTAVSSANSEVTSADLLVGGDAGRVRGSGWEGFRENRSVEKADFPPKRSSDMSSPALRLFSRFVWALG